MGLILSLDNSIHSFNKGGFVGLLDQYTGAAAGYSLRRLSVNSTNVVRVRRSSDNAESDFTADEITDGTLLAWVGNTASDNGFVTTWYDQAGSNDATQATAASQPKIVDAGVLVEENGKPAMQFDSFKHLVTSSFSALSTYTFFDVLFANNSNQFMRDGISNTNRSALYIVSTTRYNRGTGNASAYTNNIQSLYTTIASGSDTNLAQNGSSFQLLSVGSDTLTGINIGGVYDNSTLPFLGKYQELILYPSDQSSNRTGIETLLNNYYNIYP